jgi:hypothetical protein
MRQCQEWCEITIYILDTTGPQQKHMCKALEQRTNWPWTVAPNVVRLEAIS